MAPDIADEYRQGYRVGHADGFEDPRAERGIAVNGSMAYVEGYLAGIKAGRETRRYADAHGTLMEGLDGHRYRR